jgi:hypothetical protein
MTARWLQEVLQVGALPLSDRYPRNLMDSVPFHLPVAFILIDDLTTTTLEQWLECRRIAYRPASRCRRLHGALVARAGRGLIFIDGCDNHDEQRFTAAHEVAHFIDDHLGPRFKAIKAFGERILSVLDGERPPTPEESVSAVLSRVPLGLQVHLMDRGHYGTICSWDVEEREQRADRLALEIIAPARAALREIRRVGRLTVADVDRVAKALSDRFGLPESAASSYANLLLRKQRARPKLSEILVGGNKP